MLESIELQYFAKYLKKPDLRRQTLVLLILQRESEQNLLDILFTVGFLEVRIYIILQHHIGYKPDALWVLWFNHTARERDQNRYRKRDWHQIKQ